MSNKIKAYMPDVIKLIAIVGLATLFGKLFVQLEFTETNIVVIYILAVLLIARFTNGYVYGILATVLATLCFNYFFTAPYHTLAVSDPDYFITFTIMVITALVTSTLTTKDKLLTKEAEERGWESKILYTLSSRLSDAVDMESVVRITAKSVSQLLQANTGCIYLAKNKEHIYIQQVGDRQVYRTMEDVSALRRGLTGITTEFTCDGEAYNYPINGHEGLLAVVKIEKSVDKELLKEKGRLLHSILENVSLAMERISVTADRIKDRENMERERYRANLLRAISHDLRTPLSGIMGTSEMLMGMTDTGDKRYELIQGIYHDADWLHSLVKNILSLTRLKDGKIVVHKEMEAMEEVIACAVSHIEKVSFGREIQVSVPEEFRLVPMDAKLIEQVITNLLDNAVKHTSDNEKITVSVEYEEEYAKAAVRDEGEGLSNEDLSNIFQMFYTSRTTSADAKKGIGLGLTICETVVKAHGGSIIGRNREDGKGAEFIFQLPLEEGDRNV